MEPDRDKVVSARLLLGLLILAVVTAACSSGTQNAASESAESSGSAQPTTPSSEPEPSGPDLTAATALLEAALEPVEFSVPVTPFDASQAAGSDVWIISLTEEIPVLAQWSAEIRAGLEVADVNVTIWDGAFDPTKMAQGINSAVGAGADAIVLNGVPAFLVTEAIALAAADEIPVIATLSGKPEDLGIDGVVANNGFDYALAGELIGAWFCIDSEGTGNALVISADDNPSSPVETAALTGAIDEYCPDATYEVEDVPVPGWFDGTLQQLTTSLVQADPSITHILPIYDGMTLAIDPGLQDASATDIRIGSFNATPAVLEAMRSGNSVKMDVGMPNMWHSLSAADSTLRVLVGEEPVNDHGIPVHAFTPQNTEGLDLSREDPMDWYGIDFLAEYKTIWGLP